MLPGFRFLFVAVVLSVSMLVFGLGAAALLRATHEEFASLPLKQIPEVVFATRPDVEQPTLAVLQIDAPLAEAKTDQPATQNPPIAIEAPQIEATATTTTPTAVTAPDATSAMPDAVPDKVASLVATTPSDGGTITAADTRADVTSAPDATPSSVPSAEQTAAAPAPQSSAAEATPPPAAAPAEPSADATPMPTPAIPAPEATAVAAPVTTTAAPPLPPDSIAQTAADAAVATDAKAPEPSNQPAILVASAQAGDVIKSDTAKTGVIQSDAGISDVAETMTSPFGKNFRPPLPASRPTSKIASLTLPAAKKPIPRPLVAKKKIHRAAVRRSRVARPVAPKPAANALFPGSPFGS